VPRRPRLVIAALVVLLAAMPAAGRAGSIGGGPGEIARDSTRVPTGATYVPARTGPEFGLSLGTPAGINLGAGYWWGRLGLRASGMYWQESHDGGEVTVAWSPWGTPRQNAIAINRGKANFGEKDWDYVGVTYEYRGRWYYLADGLSFGHGHGFQSPQIVAQLGVLITRH